MRFEVDDRKVNGRKWSFKFLVVIALAQTSSFIATAALGWIVWVRATQKKRGVTAPSLTSGCRKYQ
jgi:hypothetical protein